MVTIFSFATLYAGKKKVVAVVSFLCCYWTFAFIKGDFLKQASPRSTLSLARASPKAANIHNRWWRERSERNLRFHKKTIKRPRARLCRLPEQEEGDHKQALNVRPLRGRFYIVHEKTAGFAAFGSSTCGYGYSPPSATLAWDDNHLKICLLCTCKSSIYIFQYWR